MSFAALCHPHRTSEEESTQEPHSDSDVNMSDEDGFIVDIERDAGSRLGMDVVSYGHGKKICVSKVTTGLIQEWNQRHAASKVNVLDEIVAVNQIGQDAEAMRDELKKATSLRIVLKKATSQGPRLRKIASTRIASEMDLLATTSAELPIQHGTSELAAPLTGANLANYASQAPTDPVATPVDPQLESPEKVALKKRRVREQDDWAEKRVRTDPSFMSCFDSRELK